MTLERQVELENTIRANGEWEGYRGRISFLYKLYRAGTLSKDQYLHQHERSTVAFAMVP